MHKQLTLDNLGGLYTYQDTLKFMQDGPGPSLDAIATGYGDKVIVYGCEDNGVNISDGWVVINGELLPFTGGLNTATKVRVVTLLTKELFDDTVLKDVYTRKYAELVAIGDFDFTELKRLNKGVFDSIKDLETIVKKIINIDDAVILSGCEVTNVSGGACDIAAGVVLMDGVLREVAAYAGAVHPVFITSIGTWASGSVPASPYIRFDPHTSQRYADVLKRAITSNGEIKMFETLSDRFDTGTGLGKWEMKGFSLMATMQSRVPVGLWYNGIAEANVTDANHNAAANQGGEKEHTLTVDELAPHTHSYVKGHVFSTGSGSDSHFTGADADNTGSAGAGDPHNNLQPYTVVVYAKRVV